MKNNYFTKVSVFFDIIPQHLDEFVSSWQVFTIGITEIRLLNSSCHKIDDLASVVSLAKK